MGAGRTDPRVHDPRSRPRKLVVRRTGEITPGEWWGGDPSGRGLRRRSKSDSRRRAVAGGEAHVVYVLALAAALANAVTSILQRMGVEDAPEDATLRLSLMTHALRRGVWLAGFAVMVGSFLCQAVALHLGDLSQVQPILTTELLLLVLLLSTWFRFPITSREWLGAFAAAGGLAGFLDRRPADGRRIGPHQPELADRRLHLRRRGGAHRAPRAPGPPLVAGRHVRRRRGRRIRLHGRPDQVGRRRGGGRLDPDVRALADLCPRRLWPGLGVPGPERVPCRTHRRLADRTGDGRPPGQPGHRHRPLRRQPADRRRLRPARGHLAC